MSLVAPVTNWVSTGTEARASDEDGGVRCALTLCGKAVIALSAPADSTRRARGERNRFTAVSEGKQRDPAGRGWGSVW